MRGEPDGASVRTALPFVDGLMPRADRYPRPKWEEIAARVTEAAPMDENAAWRSIAERWAEEHCAAAGAAYACTRSENFILASPLEKRPAANLIAFAERARRGISKALRGLAATDGLGPHVIMVFETEDEYYEYIAPFYADGGHYAGSSGVHLNSGYGHFALPRREPDLLETVVAHELTHALISHLPLPRWLDEGIAVNLESSLCPRYGRRLELSWIERHRNWWDPESVQQYWSGLAFHRPDKISELSYELAWVTVRSLAENYELFRLFASEASSEDAGQSASHKHFGHGLGKHFEAMLGDGEWEPDPTAWQEASTNTA
jgi:hypothetical protein